MSLHTPDLTKFPPRSPRVRLGGYAILPRCLDKGRATLAGKNGEYHYACPLDQGFLEFAGIDPEALKKELAKSDTRSFGMDQDQRETQTHAVRNHCVVGTGRNNARRTIRIRANIFNGLHKAGAPKRTDITTWFDVLDMDDYRDFRRQSVNFPTQKHKRHEDKIFVPF